MSEHPVVIRVIDIDHAHRHAAQKRRNIHHSADAAVGEEDGDDNDQPVISAPSSAYQPFQNQPEDTAQGHQKQGFAEGDQDVFDSETGAGENSGGYGNRNGIKHKAHHIIQRHNLEQRFHKIPFSAGLPDCHNCGGGCCGCGQGSQNDRKSEIQPEHQPTDEEHKHSSTAGFQYGNH